MKLPDGYIVSYAQNREDRIIEAFFPDIKNGFYVDVGANDPNEDSVTKLFYDNGWRGINIEPNASLHKKLSEVRTKDINLACGISDRVGEIEFREYGNHGLSTFSEEAKKQNIKSEDPKLSKYKDYKVKVRTLNDILAEYVGDRTINFMKVDVEGHEYEVLAGNDWSKYRPELICIEANHVNHDWRPLMKKAGYSPIFNDGLNEYYLRKESLNRQKYFDYANSMILSGIIVNPGVAQRIINAEKLPLLEAENNKLEAANESLQREVSLLSRQLAHYDDVRYLIRKLAVRIYRKVFGRLKA